jgi:hypothetical protein
MGEWMSGAEAQQNKKKGSSDTPTMWRNLEDVMPSEISQTQTANTN